MKKQYRINPGVVSPRKGARVTILTAAFTVLFTLPFTYAAAAGSVSTTIGASGSLTVSTTPGSTVTVQATLNTSDPNENGEGEPLNVSFPGGGFTLNGYGSSQSATFTATGSSVTINGSIVGYDGDEDATLMAFVNLKKYLDDKAKADAQFLSTNLGLISAGTETVGLVCAALPVPPVQVLCGGSLIPTGIGLGALAVIAGQIANDPPDPNFTLIAQPSTYTFPLITADAGADPAVVDTLNAWLINLAQTVAYGQALVTSINRAQGAFESGDTTWETNQIQAAHQYALQLAALLKRQPPLRAQLASAWSGAGYPTITVTPNDVYNFEADLAYNGLPAAMKASLAQLGLDASAIEQVRQLLFVQDINVVASGYGGFPAILTNPDMDAGTLHLAQALEDFAGGVANQPPVCKARPSVASLWPVNHAWTPIAILGVTDPEHQPVGIVIDKITQDEDVDAPGTGHTAPDATGVGSASASVRAERSGTGDGRVYAIHFTASDPQGETCSGTVNVAVPHDQNGTAVDSGQFYDAAAIPPGFH